MRRPNMEAVRKIEVVDFPAVILVDDKGNDFSFLGNKAARMAAIRTAGD